MGFLFSFRGRFSRVEWWSVHVLLIALHALFALAMARSHGATPAALLDALRRSDAAFVDMRWLAGLLALAVFGALMSMAATVKRQHDRGRSGWRCLIALIPAAGIAWLVIESGLLAGEDGPNRFGQAASGAPSAAGTRRPQRMARPGMDGAGLDALLQGPPEHRLARAVERSAARQAYLARNSRRSYHQAM